MKKLLLLPLALFLLTSCEKVTQQEMLNGGIEPLGGWKSFNQYLEQKLEVEKLLENLINKEK